MRLCLLAMICEPNHSTDTLISTLCKRGDMTKPVHISQHLEKIKLYSRNAFYRVKHTACDGIAGVDEVKVLLFTD